MSTVTLRQAQKALTEKRSDDARRLLQQILKENPREFRAWLYLAGLARTPAESLRYVRRAETIAPDHPLVTRARTWAEKRAQKAAAAPAPTLIESKTAVPAAAATGSRQTAATPATIQTTTPAAGETAAAVTATPPPTKTSGRRRRTLAVALLALVIVLLITAATFAWRGWQADTASAAEPAADEAVANADAGSAAGRLAGETSPAAVADEGAETVPDDAENPAPPAAAGEGATDRFAVGPLLATPAALPAGESDLPAKSVRENNTQQVWATWTPTPAPTPLPTATPSPQPTRVNPDSVDFGVYEGTVLVPTGVGINERWIDVDLTNQRLHAMEGNQVVFTTLVASGSWQYPTVTGQFRIYLRYESQTMDGRYLGFDYYLPNVPHVMYFYQGYALHGAYWRDEFGTPGSHGCVNLSLDAAAWLYSFADIGTLVNVHY